MSSPGRTRDVSKRDMQFYKVSQNDMSMIIKDLRFSPFLNNKDVVVDGNQGIFLLPLLTLIILRFIWGMLK